MSPLALEFRPRTFADVVGQGHVTTILKAAVAAERVPPALLFAGPKGTGKTSMARILAAALNCQVEASMRLVMGDACGFCEACTDIALDRSLALLEVDAASHGLIEDIRQLRSQPMYDTGVAYRVVVLDEAHMLSRAAFNALLGVLEEPPPRTTFCLLTTEPGRIPDTVVSRAMDFEFRRVPLPGMTKRLADICAAKDIVVDDRLLTEIAQRAEGGMRDAIVKLEKCTLANITTVEEFRRAEGIVEVGIPLMTAALAADYAGGMAIIDDYFYRAGDASQMVADLVGVIRDLIVIVAGGVPETPRPELVDLARQMSLPKLLAAIRAVWELKGRVRADDGHRVQMEMAFVILTEAVAQGPILEEAAPPAEEPLRTKEQLDELVAALSKGEAH